MSIRYGYRYHINVFFFSSHLTSIHYTVLIYVGRNCQLSIPDELRKIPNLLPCYLGNIPELTLALVAYTVSSYTPTSGTRKDHITANLTSTSALYCTSHVQSPLLKCLVMKKRIRRMSSCWKYALSFSFFFRYALPFITSFIIFRHC